MFVSKEQYLISRSWSKGSVYSIDGSSGMTPPLLFLPLSPPPTILPLTLPTPASSPTYIPPFFSLFPSLVLNPLLSPSPIYHSLHPCYSLLFPIPSLSPLSSSFTPDQPHPSPHRLCSGLTISVAKRSGCQNEVA